MYKKMRYFASNEYEITLIAFTMKKLLLAVFVFAASFSAALADNPPLMGWSSWNTYGFQINDSVIQAQADAMVALGFKDCGYNHINIDDGFFGGRDADGKLLIHPTRFPSGLRPLVDYIHSQGLKAGIYSDAGRNTCASFWGEPQDTIGIGVGLYGHDAEDMALFFNELDFDFIKVDYCGADAGNNAEGLDLDVEQRYKEIAAAIKATGREGVTWNICRWAFPGTWACEIADSWRTTEDIFLGWESVQSIIDQSLYLSAYTSPGHYNDMDMLEVGRGLTEEEDKTHFGMWCMMSSPLLIGCDLNDIKGNALELMQNMELIAVDQDPLGLQAYVVKSENGGHVLVKDVEEKYGTKRVVAFYNPTNSALAMSIDFSQLDLAGNVAVRDLFEKADKGVHEGTLSVNVPAHGTRIYKLVAERRLERTLYEAETAWLTSYQEIKNNEVYGTAIYSEKAICSGGVAVGWLGGRAENDLQWRNVYSENGGEYALRVYFVTGEDRTMKLSVNGGEPIVYTGNSGGWGKVGFAEFDVVLEKGENVVRLFNEEGYMGDIDKMVLADKSIVEDYPVAFDKSQSYTHGSRRLNTIFLGEQVLQVPSQQKIYTKIEDASFAAKAGETVTPTFGFTTEWMNGFVYLDRGQDGKFDAVLNADGTLPAGSDAMAFSYAEPDLGSGVGYNSNGERVNHANVLNPPAFVVPADLAPGFYQMRYKVDWASIDPAGRPEDGNGIIKNGGAICDVRINVHGDKATLSVAAENGSLLAADGSQLPSEVPFGSPLMLKVVPAEGYMLDAIKVKHGHNLDGERVVHGVAQYAQEIIPGFLVKEGTVELPASMVDGDVRIEAIFAVGDSNAGMPGYGVAFDREAVMAADYKGVVTVNGADVNVDGRNIYKECLDRVAALYNSKMLDVAVDDDAEGLGYYLYIDMNGDGKFTVLLDNGVPAVSSELVAYTNYNGKNSRGEEVASYGKVLPTVTLPDMLPEGLYRARLKADGDDLSPEGSAAIVENGGMVVDFYINVVRGVKSLKIYTVNGSIDGENYTALPCTLVPMQPLNVVLRPAPGYELESFTVRHGHNIAGEQYVGGSKQWNEDVVAVNGNSVTVDASLLDGDVALYANFVAMEEGEWTLVFSDEFNAADGSEPVGDKWMRCQRQGATWNRWLSDSKEVIYEEGGDLVARAIPNPDTSVDNVPMITGGIKSNGRFGFTYGYVEARIFSNPWVGNFPAFWMMPEDQSAGWPDCGEIDIWETIDSQERSWHTVHSNWTYDLGNKGGSSYNVATPLDRYHTYGLEWNETMLIWYVDGKEVGRYTKSSNGSELSQGQWPFDKHFHLILNQSVGNGAWAANADVNHVYETRFDWVRVYQKDGMANTLGTVGVTEVNAGVEVDVEAVDGGVKVCAEEPARVVVFDMTGRKVAAVDVVGASYIALPKGIYIVAGNKVVVK